jgi:predicted nucleic acid-binding protein
VNSQQLYLVDSTIWIGLVRRKVSKELADRVDQLLESDAVATNEVIRLEVLVGCRTERDYAQNDADFAGFIHFPVRAPTWYSATELGFRLRRLGASPSVPDLLIAASALERGAVVLHADADFDRIAQHSTLMVESWAKTNPVTGS